MLRFAAGLSLIALGCAGAAGPTGAPILSGDDVDAGAPCQPLQGTVTSISAGTWCVTGDVIIPTGVTLDVPPGTTFLFTGRFHFGRDPSLPDAAPPIIPGSGGLRAIGTADLPIVFRGQTPDTRWFGIVIAHAQDSVHLEYVTIRDALKDDPAPGKSNWRRGGGLGSYENVKGTIVRHCTFAHNGASSVAGALEISGHGVWPAQGPVELTDSRFEDNECQCALYFPSPDDLCGGGALRVSHVSGDADLVKVTGNLFRHNASRRSAEVDAYGGAIAGFSSGLVLGPGNVFDGNSADTGDGAISCSHHPELGTIIDAIDPSVVFTANAPDNGCGR